MGLYLNDGAVVIKSIGTADSETLVNTYAKWSIEELSYGYVIRPQGVAGLALRLGQVSTSTGIDLATGTYSGSNPSHHWNLSPISYVAPDVLLYDTATGAYVANPQKYVAPEETRSLANLSLAAAVVSSSTNNQSVYWETVGNGGNATIQAQTGTVTGVVPGSITIRARTTIDGNTQEASYTLNVTLLKNGAYFFKNTGTNKYLETNGNTGTGKNVYQYDFEDKDAQRWIITHLGDGFYSIETAMSGDRLFLAVLNNSSDNSASITLQETLSSGAEWRIAVTVANNFVLTAKVGLENNCVLAVKNNTYNLNMEAVQQLTYSNDSNYRDEWTVVTSNEFALMYMGINEADDSGYETMVPIQNALEIDAKMRGYASTDVTENELMEWLLNCRIFSCLTHGNSNCLATSDGQLTVDDIMALPDNALGHVDLVVLGACRTAEGGAQGDNIVRAFYEKGVKTVIGFNIDVNVVETHLWMKTFMLAIADGSTIEDALAAADQAVYVDYLENRVYSITTSAYNRVVLGETSYTLC